MTYTATAFGQTFTKNTGRVYTHAVVYRMTKGMVGRVCVSWAGSADKAEKVARSKSKCADVEIVDLSA